VSTDARPWVSSIACFLVHGCPPLLEFREASPADCLPWCVSTLEKTRSYPTIKTYRIAHLMLAIAVAAFGCFTLMQCSAFERMISTDALNDSVLPTSAEYLASVKKTQNFRIKLNKIMLEKNAELAAESLILQKKREKWRQMIEEKNKGRHPLFGEKMDKEERRKVDTQGGR
jgi:hypothetical protein